MNPFQGIMQGKVVIVGIGNPLRGDDGLGCELVHRLNGRVSAVCLDTGSTPENYVGTILREAPDTLLVIDAMHLNKESGEFAIMSPEELAQSFPTTHGFPIQLWCEQLAHNGVPKIVLLGVQPRQMQIGDTFSPQVEQTLGRFEQWIVDYLRFEI